MPLRSASSDIASRTAGSLNAKCLRLDARALAVDFVPRVLGVELDELDVAALHDQRPALAAGLEAFEHLVFDLQVPGVVELAGLQHRARGRGRVAAALHLDRVEKRAVRHVVVRVDLAAHHVARLEVDELVRAGADRLQVGRRVARLRADVRCEHVLRDDHALGRDKERGPERRRLRERDPDRERIDLRHRRRPCTRRSSPQRSPGPRVFPGEDDSRRQ